MTIAKAQFQFQINGRINAVDTAQSLSESNLATFVDVVAVNGISVDLSTLDPLNLTNLSTAILNLIAMEDLGDGKVPGAPSPTPTRTPTPTPTSSITPTPSPSPSHTPTPT